MLNSVWSESWVSGLAARIASYAFVWEFVFHNLLCSACIERMFLGEVSFWCAVSLNGLNLIITRKLIPGYLHTILTCDHYIL